jgi:hypothetical protein
MTAFLISAIMLYFTDGFFYGIHFFHCRFLKFEI